MNGVSRVDVREIAEVAVKALGEDGHAGAAYSLVGPDALSAGAVAAILGAELGKELRSLETVDEWAKHVKDAGLPVWLLDNLKVMYRDIIGRGLAATREEVLNMETLLGRKPLDYYAYAKELAAAWGPASK